MSSPNTPPPDKSISEADWEETIALMEQKGTNAYGDADEQILVPFETSRFEIFGTDRIAGKLKSASFLSPAITSDAIFAIGTPEEVLREENLKEVFDVQVLLDENPASKKIRVTTIY